MDLGLRGKSVVITGGTRGIGHAITLVCAAEGANIALCARGQEGIDSTLREKAICALWLMFCCLLSDPAQIALTPSENRSR